MTIALKVGKKKSNENFDKKTFLTVFCFVILFQDFSVKEIIVKTNTV